MEQTVCQSQLEPVLQMKHDSTKFIDVMESISEYLDDSMIDEIVTVYAGQGL